jgi:hypothetical protein
VPSLVSPDGTPSKAAVPTPSVAPDMYAWPANVVTSPVARSSLRMVSTSSEMKRLPLPSSAMLLG